MLLVHTRRRTDSISQKTQNPIPSLIFSSSKALRGLSLSFYDEQTITKNKQIILDHYQFCDEKPKNKKITLTQSKKHSKKKDNASYDSRSKRQKSAKKKEKVSEKKRDLFEMFTTDDSKVNLFSKERIDLSKNTQRQSKKCFGRSNSRGDKYSFENDGGFLGFQAELKWLRCKKAQNLLQKRQNFNGHK